MTSIKLSVLKSALARTIPFASTDESRPVLCGILIQSDDKSTRFVAADGFRLSVTTLEGVTSPDPWQYVIPAKSLAGILKIKSGRTDPDVVLSPVKKSLLLDTAKALLIDGKQYDAIDGMYPDYQQIIPRIQSAKITGILPADFGAAADHMVSFWKRLDGSNVVRWSVTPTGHVLKASDEEIGSARWDMASPVDCARPMMIGANCNFLRSVCKASEGYAVTVRMTAPSAPMRFDFARSESDTTIMVVMPMHLAAAYGSDVNLGDPLTPFDLPALAEKSQADIDLENNNYNEHLQAWKAQCKVTAEMEPVVDGHNFYATSTDLDYPKPDPKGTYAQDLTGAKCGVTTPTYGKGTAYISLEFSQPVSVTSNNTIRPNKSELMTWLNVTRAKIKRSFGHNPSICDALLRDLYRAFGHAQMKNPPALDCSLNWHIIATLELPAYVEKRRKEHDITPLVNRTSAPCHTITTSVSVSQ